MNVLFEVCHFLIQRIMAKKLSPCHAVPSKYPFTCLNLQIEARTHLYHKVIVRDLYNG